MACIEWEPKQRGVRGSGDWATEGDQAPRACEAADR